VIAARLSNLVGLQLSSTVVLLALVFVLILGLLSGSSVLLALAITGFGLVAAIELVSSPESILEAPFIGGGLLATAELGFWSLELQANCAQSRAVVARRVVAITCLVVLGAALSGAFISVLELLGLFGSS